MSKADFQRKKKDEEEQKVVGQQQKTQSSASNPVGSTSIPKNNQGISGRTQSSAASSSRSEERRETENQNVVKRNTFTANTSENRRNQFIEDIKSGRPNYTYYKDNRNNDKKHSGSGGTWGNNETVSGGPWGYNKTVDAARSRYALSLKNRTTQQMLSSGQQGVNDALKMAKGYSQNGIPGPESLPTVEEYKRSQMSEADRMRDIANNIDIGQFKTKEAPQYRNGVLWKGEIEKKETPTIKGSDIGIKENITPEIEQQMLSPGYKLDDEARKIAREYAQQELAKYTSGPGGVPQFNSEEDRQRYAELRNLANKTSPFASFMEGFTDPFEKTATFVRDILPKSDQAKANNEIIDQYRNTAKANASAQNPMLTGAGQLAGNVAEYALTEPIVNAVAGAAGVKSTAGKFLVNQLANAGQDAALSWAPEYNKLSKRDDLTNQQKALEMAKTIGLDIGGNAIGGTLGLLGSRAGREAAENAIRDTVTEQAAKEIAPGAPFKGITDIPYQNADEIIQRNFNKALGYDNPLYKLKDAELTNLARRGGTQNGLADVYDRLLHASERESIDDFTAALNDYRNAVDANGAQGLNRSLQRIEDIVNGNIPENVPTDTFGNISHNIDAIEDGLNRVEALEGLSDRGKKYLNNSRELLNQYEAAVRSGSDDVYSIAENLKNTLGNVDYHAKKLAGYDGTFSAWKGGNTARGDLYSNTGKIQKTTTDMPTPEEQAMFDEWNARDAETMHAKPANQENVVANNVPSVPTESELPKADNTVPGIPEETVRYGNSKVVTNTAKNADIVTAKQIKEDPIIKDIMQYEKHSNVETLDNAIKRIDTEGTVWKDDFISGKKAISDDTDVDTAMLLMQDLNKKIDGTQDTKLIEQYTNEKNALLRKLREFGTKSGQNVQSFAKWNNTADGAMLTATKVQEDDIIKPWKSQNAKAVKGNSRIAQALANSGNDTKLGSKIREPLTHEQIKEGVIAEIEKEFGSVEDHFNKNDIEFLTQMAENKKIPVWQITDEIEHKLKTGDWYTLDESIQKPKHTNQKLTNALNSLFEEGGVRKAEPVQKSMKQIREEVKNTLEKEAASFDGKFTDSDIDYISNLVGNNATKQEIADALNTKMATGTFGISAETQQKVNDLFKQAEMYNPNSKKFVDCQTEAFRLLADEVAPNATPMEKFETWRYMAMLGNPKTMLRNYIGNETFGVVTGISNNLSAITEAAIDKTSKALGGKGIQRTKSVLNPITDSDLIKASSMDADISRYRQIAGTKYEKMDKNALKKARSVFKSKLMQLGEKAVDAGISDYKAVKKKYSTSLAGYLKANGFDKSIFNAEDELARLKNLSEVSVLSKADNAKIEKLKKNIAELDKARDFALKQAEYSTFHEDNAFAKWLTKVSNEAPGVGHAIIEGIVPFKKTPANVLKSGIDYSPLGAIDSIKKTGKLIYENTGKRAGNLADTYINAKGKEVTKTLASDVIDSWSKTLTGSGLTALGFYLYNKGVLLDSDNETKYQDQLEGLQNYSIKINGKTYTIDWAAPSAIPLLLGAEISKVRNSQGESSEKWYENLDKYLSAANKIADPIVEMSFLEGIQNTIETASNAVKNNDFMSIPAMIGYNAATGYATQAIPTLSGQIARTIDNTRRSTYTDKEGVAGVLDKQATKLKNKIPFLSKTSEPYVDTYGREQKNGPSDNPFINFAYQSMSPGYLADVNTTEADKVSRELYEKTGDDSILPAWQASVKVDGEKASPETYTEFARVYGETNYKIRDELANNEWFNGLSDEDKAEIFHDINNLSKNMGQAAINENFTSSSKPYEAYSQGGTEGLIEYYKKQMIKSKANESGLAPTSKASQEIQADLEAGNEEAAQAKIDAAQELNSLGLSSSYAVSSYYKATETIPNLTPTEFADTYQAMDTDGNQSLKQDEVISYLNDNKITSQSEADKLWKAYGKDWKSIPSLVDGEWVSKSNKKGKSKASGKTSAKTSGGNTSFEIKPTGNNNLDAKLKAKAKVREDYLNNKIPTPEDLPTAESTTQSSDGLNWSLSNGYDLKNTKTYQRAREAGVSDADFNAAWFAADADGNGYMKKAEARNYVNSLNASDEERNKWFHILYKGR